MGLFAFWSSPAQTHGVLREVFSNLPGSSIPDLTNAAKFPNKADDSFLEVAFEAVAGRLVRRRLCHPPICCGNSHRLPLHLPCFMGLCHYCHYCHFQLEIGWPTALFGATALTT